MKVSVVPAFLTIKKPNVLFSVEVMMAIAVLEAVVVKKMEMEALDKNILIHKNISLFPFQVNKLRLYD